MKGSCFKDYIPGDTAISLLQFGNRVGPSAGIPVEFGREYLRSELGAALPVQMRFVGDVQNSWALLRYGFLLGY